MDITPLIPKGKQVIEKYGNGGFTISGRKFSSSVIIFPDEVVQWEVASPDKSIQALLDYVTSAENREKFAQADIFILGTGSEVQFIEGNLKESFRRHGIYLEVMTTGSACSTYNVLLTEGRNIIAALVVV